MNIKEIILSRLAPKEGVNDSKWLLKLSNLQDKDKGYSITIILSNSAIIESDFGNFNHIPVKFKLKFKLTKCGFVEFFCLTVDKHNNRGGAAQDKARLILKAHYAYLRQELRAA